MNLLRLSAHAAMPLDLLATSRQIGADDRIYLLWSTLVSFERPGKTFAKSHRLALSVLERHRQSATAQEATHANKLRGLYSQFKCCPVCNQLLPRSQVDFLVRSRSYAAELRVLSFQTADTATT